MEKNNKRELVPCPLCEGYKGKGYLVCAECHKKKWVEIAATEAMTGKILTKEEWGERKIREVLPNLEEVVKKAEVHYKRLKKLYQEELETIYREKIKKRLPQDVAERVREKIKEIEGKEVWKKIKGPEAFRNLKIAEERLKEAERLLKDLELKKTTSTIVGIAEKILKEENR